ncbi:MAG: succinate dehydrogenase/fumarate reductase iron-sulfur subunit [Pseudobutyrivibrio sp.]|nr:succinate dehydrogenase/fumarate reductase iron-sulfur subunit [Pseudobutyrivibrio sp.]
MKKTLHIKRREINSDTSFWQDFSFESEDESATVATALMTLPVAWSHSCLQKKCGACAMVINGRPSLACDVRLSELKGDMVTIEPLRKFPVIEDLLVDRDSLMARLKQNNAWFEEEAKAHGEELAFESGKCLQCGLCLEVCPNFHNEGNYGGMALMTVMSQIMSKAPDMQKKDLGKNYRKNVYNGCGKSLACRDICPAKIDMEKLLVKSNAAALWNKWDETNK